MINPIIFTRSIKTGYRTAIAAPKAATLSCAAPQRAQHMPRRKWHSHASGCGAYTGRAPGAHAMSGADAEGGRHRWGRPAPAGTGTG
eukprot:COSAG01_NODE_8082_length_2927_cov_5.885472_4_plen_87_part_00